MSANRQSYHTVFQCKKCDKTIIRAENNTPNDDTKMTIALKVHEEEHDFDNTIWNVSRQVLKKHLCIDAICDNKYLKKTLPITPGNQ